MTIKRLSLQQQVQNTNKLLLTSSAQVTERLIHDYLRDLDCPRSLTVWLLYKNKEHQQLVDLSISPQEYNCSHGFRVSYLATLFLSKYDSLELPDHNRSTVALEKFFRMERHCANINRQVSDEKFLSGEIGDRIATARRKISQILGTFDSAGLLNSCGWGPGVTTRLKAGMTSWADKFQFETGISRDFFEFSREWIGLVNPRSTWGEQPTSFENSNQLLTVPKNSKTDRVIAVEPGINLFFQKAIGSMIRKQLFLACGLDLSMAAEKHQKLARQGSVDGVLATIDFSSASDTISKSVVELLLPHDWFLVLDALRSKGAVVDGSWAHWNKFSSMGNGFTFELETLIFYAIAYACVDEGDRHTISVFGDDVVLPSANCDIFSAVSTKLGFIFNNDKSFSSGNFRESCGAHFFKGIDCKPTYLKTQVRSLPILMSTLNRLYTTNNGVSAAWRNLIKVIPKEVRFYGPSTLGDQVITSDRQWWSPRPSRDGWCGSFFLVLYNQPRLKMVYFEGLLTSKLFGLHKQDNASCLPIDERPEPTSNDLPTGRSSLRIQRSFVPTKLL